MSPCGYSQTHTLQLNTVQPILFVFDYCSPCQPDSNHLASHTFPMACHILYVMEDVTTPRHIRRVPNKPNYLLQRVWCRLQIEYVAVGVKLSHLSRSRRVRADEARGALDGTWPRAGRDRGRAIESGAGDARRPIPCTKMAKRMDSRRRDRACIRNLSSMDRSRRRRPAAIARTPHVVPLPFLLCAGSLVLVHHMLAACMHGEPPPPPGILIESVSARRFHDWPGEPARAAPTRVRDVHHDSTSAHAWMVDRSISSPLPAHARDESTGARARLLPCPCRLLLPPPVPDARMHVAYPPSRGRACCRAGASQRALDRWQRQRAHVACRPAGEPGGAGSALVSRAVESRARGALSAWSTWTTNNGRRRPGRARGRRRRRQCMPSGGVHPRAARLRGRLCTASAHACTCCGWRSTHDPLGTYWERAFDAGPRPGVALKEYGGSCSLSWSIVGSIVAGGFCCGKEGAESETMSAVHAVSGSRA